MKCLVTGGCGFVGSYLIRALLEKGHQVVNLDVVRTSSVHEIVLSEEERKQVVYVAGSVTNFPLLLDTVKRYNIDRIAHMATLLTTTSEEDPISAIEINCIGTANTFEVAKFSDVQRIVYASTINVFGKGTLYGGMIDDHAPHYPPSLYGACKSFNERIAASYLENYNLDTIGLRFTTVYGFGRPSKGTGSFIVDMIRNALEGKTIQVPFVDEIIDWEYVKDTARAVVLALECPERTKTPVFTVGGDWRKVREGSEYLMKRFPGIQAEYPIIEERDYYQRTLPRPHCDKTAIKEEIGYTPLYTMEKGIDEIIESMIKVRK